MRYKTGDRVKFLDQKGGGVITKIISSQVVNVKDENGFEIPTLVKDLVKIEEDIPSSAKMFIESDTEKIAKITNETFEKEDNYSDNQISALKSGYNSDKIKQGIYLAFVPHEQQWLLMGNLDLYVLNYTNYDAFYSLFLNDNDGVEGIDYNIIPPNSKSYIATIEREDLNLWLKGAVQVLFHSNHLEKILPPISSEFKIAGDKFYKESSFVYTPIMSDKVLLIEIEKID